MTSTSTAFTTLLDSADAGRHLGAQVKEALGGEPPDVVILFASSRFDHPALLAALDGACSPRILVGASSAGEFADRNRGEGTASVLAIRSDVLGFAAGIGHDVAGDRAAAARDLLSTFNGLGEREHRHRAAIVMTDALAGHAEELVDQLTLQTSGRYAFAGGGAGDDAHFARTHVFLGTKVYGGSVVGLEILSEQPLGIGVGHGWTPASAALRVTAAEGKRVVSLNGLPAIDAFEAHAAATGQALDRAAPLPFFLHNILAIDTGTGHRLRVPLAVTSEGAIDCAAEVPVGARVYIMTTTDASAVAAAAEATRAAMAALDGAKPGAALFFDCVATRLRMGEGFGFELDAVNQLLEGAGLVGCNTYGQIARAEGQFGGFHNCTAVVMVLPA